MKNRLFTILAGLLMLSAMMPMTAGTVFAEADNDITKPVIDMNSLSITLPEGKDKVTVGDTVTISMEVSDDREMSSVWIDLIKPVTNHRQQLYFDYQGEDNATKNGLWTATFTVDDETENGIWKTNMIAARDTSDNTDHYYDSTLHPNTSPIADLSSLIYEVTSPDCPLDLTTPGYSMMLNGAGATKTFGGNYYVNSADDTVTPTVKVRFESEDGTWNTLSPRKYTLRYEKKTGENSWEDYTADTFGVDESRTATYRVSATGKESLYYTGTVGPAEFNVVRKCKVTFDTRGGTAIAPQYVIPGERATKPDDPTRKGFSNCMWYSDERLARDYYWGEVNNDITLYAKWFADMSIGIYNASNPENNQCGTFDIESEAYSQTKRVAKSFNLEEGRLTLIANPAKGYTFKGFYKGVVDSDNNVKAPTEELLWEDSVYERNIESTAICAVFECSGHQWEQKIKKATPTADGRVYRTCKVCRTEETISPIAKASKIKLAGTSYTYTGKAITPKVTVANGNESLSADNYSVSYSKNKNVGTATAKVTLKGKYYEGSKTLTFKINKAANTLAVKGKTATVKYKKLKKKNQTLSVSKVITVTKKGQGAMTYAKASGNKKITINKTTGKVTVKKGLKKGTYRVGVKVKAAGNANVNASAWKVVTVTVKVK